MKILMLAENQINKYNWGHQLFRNEICRQHDVICYGNGFNNDNLSLIDFLKKNKLSFNDFDFVFTHGLKYTKKIKDIKNIPSNILKVHYVVDFFLPKREFKGRDKAQYEFLNYYKPHIIFSVYHNSIQLIKQNIKNEKVFVLPFSVCTKTYKNLNLNKTNSVMACFSCRNDVYPNRIKALNFLNKNNIKYVNGKKNYDYIKAINECKISLGICDIYKSLNMRVTEILACGGFFLTDKPNYIEKIDLIENKHYVTFNTFNDMIDKIKYFQKNDKLRKKIEIEGMKFVRKNHSCEKRVKEMIDIINNNL